jgi:hypothetical protein
MSTLTQTSPARRWRLLRAAILCVGLGVALTFGLVTVLDPPPRQTVVLVGELPPAPDPAFARMRELRQVARDHGASVVIGYRRTEPPAATVTPPPSAKTSSRPSSTSRPDRRPASSREDAGTTPATQVPAVVGSLSAPIYLEVVDPEDGNGVIRSLPSSVTVLGDEGQVLREGAEGRGRIGSLLLFGLGVAAAGAALAWRPSALAVAGSRVAPADEPPEAADPPAEGRPPVTPTPPGRAAVGTAAGQAAVGTASTGQGSAGTAVAGRAVGSAPAGQAAVGKALAGQAAVGTAPAEGGGSAPVEGRAAVGRAAFMAPGGVADPPPGAGRSAPSSGYAGIAPVRAADQILHRHTSQQPGSWLPQCPHCGSFSVGSPGPDAIAYSCNECGHGWTAPKREPWPDVTLSPRRRRRS